MILGRSTVQWTALITALGGLVQLLVVQFVAGADPTVIATIIGAVVAFLGTFIAFLANTATTPTSDPRLQVDTEVSVIDRDGNLTSDKVVIKPSPPGPVGYDAGEAQG